ncbi:ORF6N domain-containing protein [Mucilaginibacter sp. ZT4R22]|uniref:ORF6N domain-containing protein n=1 Tax=Mucilaginibacter pankratovii TaxID=2772110 RepID=A0ABR7WSR7_9SPHI|nr:ORF6N domain-containing protein [Mucilaginibacter pankratovii]MBD1365353.1 ORF6N domain-containing protein [Mucilaginibacter pankratovii]
MTTLLSGDKAISDKIYLLRGYNVMLDSDLAELYEVETRVLNQSVNRHPDRFPPDFMFELTEEEWQNLKSQIVTSSWGGRRKAPKAFTEHGVLMLSSILNSQRAIQLNIQIVRVFAHLREFINSNTEIKLEIEKIKKELSNQGKTCK